MKLSFSKVRANLGERFYSIKRKLLKPNRQRALKAKPTSGKPH